MSCNFTVPLDETHIDRLSVRQLVENWVVWRDAGMWDRFRSVWHEDGRMVATWTEGSADEFIEMSKLAWEKGSSGLHFLGGHAADFAGSRAVAQTKMMIAQRGRIHGVEVDVVCTGRFYDLLEKRRGKWGFVLRQPIYERDRMDPVEPGQIVRLNRQILDSFPVGYRHLAYLQKELGLSVKNDLPGLRGPAIDALYARGCAWLEGHQ